LANNTEMDYDISGNTRKFLSLRAAYCYSADNYERECYPEGYGNDIADYRESVKS